MHCSKWRHEQTRQTTCSHPPSLAPPQDIGVDSSWALCSHAWAFKGSEIPFAGFFLQHGPDSPSTLVHGLFWIPTKSFLPSPLQHSHLLNLQTLGSLRHGLKIISQNVVYLFSLVFPPHQARPICPANAPSSHWLFIMYCSFTSFPKVSLCFSGFFFSEQRNLDSWAALSAINCITHSTWKLQTSLALRIFPPTVT